MPNAKDYGKWISDTEAVINFRGRCQVLDNILVDRGQKPFAIEKFNDLIKPTMKLDEAASRLGNLPGFVEGAIVLLKATGSK